MTPVFVFLCALVIAAILTPLLRQISLRLNLLDVPNERSSHLRPTPRNGGYALVVATLAAVLASRSISERGVLVLVAASLLIALAAAADEFRPLHRGLRLALQISIAAAAVILGDALLRFIDLPFLGRVTFIPAFAVAISVFWIVGVINGFNFMDGLNGIASVEAIICALTLYLLFVRSADTAGAFVALALAGAVAGFLPWNFPSGSIFMGDVGSATLGFVLAMLVLRVSQEGVSLIAAALPLFPFLFDSGITILRRAARGERFFSSPHRTHFYQRLSIQGWSHGAVTTLWGALAAISASVAIAYDRVEDRMKIILLMLVVGTHVAVAVWISALEHSKLDRGQASE